MLRYRRALQAQFVGIGEQDDQRGGGAHQQRVDKHAHKRRHALLHGVLHVCRGMGVRGGTHAGLVGKQAACHAEAHCFAHADAGRAAQYRLRVKRRGEDVVEHRRNVAGEFEQNHNRADDVDDGHKRHHKLRDFGNAVHPAHDNQPGQHRQADAHRQRRYVEGHGYRRRDGVGLGGVADEAQRDNQRNRETSGEETRRAAADFRREPVRDVKRRAADVFAVADHAVFLRQERFGKDGGHAQNGGKPHPKHRARPAGSNCRGHAGHVARADLGGHGHRQRLKLRQRFVVFVGGIFLGKEPAEYRFECCAELGELRHAQVNAEKEADAE